MIKALAVVCVRDEAIHIRRCLSDLISSGLDVIVIDNDSSDGSREIASEFLGRGVLAIEHLPFHGSFSLSDQLRAKQLVYSSTNHDWLVHVDADEWLVSPVAGQSLLEGIAEADKAGSTCINFHEIVFVPLAGEDYYAEGYARRMSSYYFVQPYYPRLNRAWKRTANLARGASDGHSLSGPGLRLFKRDFILRHYVVLSEQHARTKYVGRAFSAEDRAKGWHVHRITVKPEHLKVKQVPGLKKTPDPCLHQFDLTRPLKKHFWQW